MPVCNNNAGNWDYIVYGVDRTGTTTQYAVVTVIGDIVCGVDRIGSMLAIDNFVDLIVYFQSPSFQYPEHIDIEASYEYS